MKIFLQQQQPRRASLPMQQQKAYLTAAALILAAASAGYAYYGHQQQKKTAKAIGAYNAQQSENDANAMELENRENIRRKRMDSVRLLAVQRSKYAKAGVVAEGTPLEVQAETAGLLELDALEMNRQAQNKVARLRAEGRMQKAAGEAGAYAQNIQAGASLLSGVSAAAGGYANYKNTGGTY
jgi:hypothetical protein